MQIVGIIAEYNPLHCGHLYQIERIRNLLGENTAMICIMSGNYVQRGDFAVLRKHVRAEAAVRSGADLILELPLPWAISSAERFAEGGVKLLNGTGITTYLAFGSECGDTEKLQRIAWILESTEFSSRLRSELKTGVSFAAARQTVVEDFLGEDDGKILSQPNDILGVEYCRSLFREKSSLIPLAIRREGAGHHGGISGDSASSGEIRRCLAEGKREQAISLMAPAMQTLYEGEERFGRAPVLMKNCQRGILAKLRTMTAENFLLLDGGNEGLGNRFYNAARSAATLEKLLGEVKTKRYAYARLRRMALWAYLGLFPADMPEAPPYLRVLAANALGRELLARMRTTSAIPILTKPADVRLLPDTARRLFALEARATDLYTLAYPELAAAQGGAEWKIGPVMV
jgi:predicted nucleotidyltransferase